MNNKIFSPDSFKNEIKKEMLNLNEKLDKLDINKDGQHYGLIQLSPLTGAGKSMASKEICDEKVADMIEKDNMKPCTVVFTTSKKNNLPGNNSYDFPRISALEKRNKKKYIHRIYSVIEDEKNFSDSWQVPQTKKEIISEFRKLYNQKIIAKKIYDKLLDVLNKYSENIRYYSSLTSKNEESGQNIYGQMIQQIQRSKNSNRSELNKILRLIFTKAMMVNQLTNGNYDGPYMAFSKKLDQESICKYSLKNLRDHIQINYLDQQLVYCFQNFKLVRLLYSALGLAIYPVNMVTISKLVYPNNMIMSSQIHLYDVIPKINKNGAMLFLDESSKTQSDIQSMINQNAIVDNDLILACSIIYDLSKSQLETGIIADDPESTKKKLRKIIAPITKIFKKYKLQYALHPDDSLKRNRTMFASSPEFSIQESNSSGSLRYLIDTKNNNKTHFNVLIDIGSSFEDITDKKEKINRIKKIRQELKKKNNNDRYISVSWLLPKLRNALISSVWNLSVTAFNKNKKHDGDIRWLVRNLFVHKGNETKAYEIFNKIYQTNLNVSLHKSYDEDLFTQGINFYVVEVDRDNFVSIKWMQIPNTSDRIVADMATKMKIFALDATGDLAEDFNNYSRFWLQAHLNNHYINQTDEKLLDMFRKLLTEQKKQIMPVAFKFMDYVTANKNEILHDVIDDILDEKDICLYNAKLADNINNFLDIHFDNNSYIWGLSFKEINEEYADDPQIAHLIPHLYLLQSIIRFINYHQSHIEYRSLLCLINAKINGSQMQALNNIVSYYIRQHKYSLPLVAKKGDYDDQLINFWDSKDFNNGNVEKVINSLEKGRMRIVISTYATMGNGQNIDYKIPDISEIKDKVVDLNLGERPKEDRKDWDAIYLSHVTNVVTSPNQIKPTQNFEERTLAILESAVSFNRLSWFGNLARKQYLAEIRRILQRGSWMNDIFGENEEYDDYAKYIGYTKTRGARASSTAIIAQALGRLNRTDNRLKQLIFFDPEIEKKTNFKEYGNKEYSGKQYPILTALEESLVNSFGSLTIDDLPELTTMDEENNMFIIHESLQKAQQIKSKVGENAPKFWLAYDRCRSVILQQPILDEKENQCMQEYLATLQNSSQLNSDSRLASWLHFAYIKAPEPVNCYYVTTNNPNSNLDNFAHHEEYKKIIWDANSPELKENKNQIIKIDLSENNRMATILNNVDGLKKYYQTIKPIDFLNQEEINLLSKELINRNKDSSDTEFENTLLSKVPMFTNFGKKATYLLNPSIYMMMLGAFGEIATQYIFEHKINELGVKQFI
ncbi:hypothetical protein [Lactobacillus hamsteri]|uniref:hypothetical protein n=1 Tax=Lactobacillus hamsteri TaxID=96565 RepID=UPI00046A4218|nr:hypothetical protein [Lactobacillus hamsteri]